MCNINFNMKSKRNFGYKVVAVDYDNNIYSIFTGQKYNLGKVEEPPAKANPICAWNPILHIKYLSECGFYKKEYVGYTSAFTNRTNAKVFLIAKENDIIHHARGKFEIKLAKITFNGDCFIGTYDTNIRDFSSSKVIAGNNIKSIEIL